MAVVQPINLNVSCKLQRTQSPPGHVFPWKSFGSLFCGVDHGIHSWWDLTRSKWLSSGSICCTQVFARFSGHDNSIYNGNKLINFFFLNIFAHAKKILWHEESCILDEDVYLQIKINAFIDSHTNYNAENAYNYYNELQLMKIDWYNKINKNRFVKACKLSPLILSRKGCVIQGLEVNKRPYWFMCKCEKKGVIKASPYAECCTLSSLYLTRLFLLCFLQQFFFF